MAKEFDDLKERLKTCTAEDIPELVRVIHDLREVLIEYVGAILKDRSMVGTQKKMKKWITTWHTLVSELEDDKEVIKEMETEKGGEKNVIERDKEALKIMGEIFHGNGLRIDNYHS